MTELETRLLAGLINYVLGLCAGIYIGRRAMDREWQKKLSKVEPKEADRA